MLCKVIIEFLGASDGTFRKKLVDTVCLSR